MRRARLRRPPRPPRRSRARAAAYQLPTWKIENSSVRRRVVSASFAVPLLLLAGCSAKHPQATSKGAVVVVHAKAPWKRVIDDWHDGRIDQRHSCAAVRQAIDHLPISSTFSHARPDLEAYARTVC